MKSLRLGILGAGQICDRHAATVQELESVEVVALCARSPDRTEEKAKTLGIPHTFTRVEQMLEEANLDGLIIATPNAVRSEPILSALKHGVAVLSEKPMATSFQDARAMVECAEAHQTLYQVLPHENYPLVHQTRELLASHSIGPFVGADATILFSGPPRANWYYDLATSHGGVLLDTGIYAVSRLISLLGPATRVTSMANTLIPNRTVEDTELTTKVEDNTVTVVQWANGQYAMIRAAWGPSVPRFETSIYGRNGTIFLTPNELLVCTESGESPHRSARPTQVAGGKNWYQIPVENEHGYQFSNQYAVRDFVHALHQGEHKSPSARAQLHAHEIVFASYASAREGRRVDLTTSFSPEHALDDVFYDTKSKFL